MWRLKNIAQCEKLHNLRDVCCFIWGKMRTAAQETAPQIVLRSCSQEVGEGRSIYNIFVKGEFSATSCLLYRRFSARPEELMSL